MVSLSKSLQRIIFGCLVAGSLLPCGSINSFFGHAVGALFLWKVTATKSRSSWMVVSSLSPLLLATFVTAQEVSAFSVPSTNFVTQASVWYLGCLDAKPLWTKSVTSGVIHFMGDYCAQGYESYRMRSEQGKTTTPAILVSVPRYNVRRGLAFLADGLFLSAPLMHYSFGLMEHFFPTKQQTWLTPLYHVILNDTLVDGIYIAISFVFVAIAEGHLKDLGALIRKDLFATIRASWGSSLIFGPIEYVCFRQLPVHLRVLAMSIIHILWGAFISFVAHRSRHGKVVPRASLATTIDVVMSSVSGDEDDSSALF